MHITPFTEIYGDGPILRVINFLILNDEFDHSMTDITESSGVGYSTLKLFLPILEANGIVKHVRTIGKAEMYCLNKTNPVVKKLKELYWTVTGKAVHEALEEEKVLEN
mgnify:CR=1 FL=1